MKRLINILCVVIVITGIAYSQSITITSPKMSKIWFKGKTYNITWTGSGYTPSGIKINMFRNSISQSNFVLQLTGNDTGSKSWKVPDNFPNGYYIMRIKTSDNNVRADSNKFKISEESAPPPPASPSRDRFKTKALNVNPSAKSGPTPIRRTPSNVNVNTSAKSGPTPIRPTPTNAPDLVITSFRQDPPNPQKGEHWKFKVSVKNIGTIKAHFPKNRYHAIAHNAKGSFRGEVKNWDITISPGQTQEVAIYSGVDHVGTFPVTFKVDPGNIVKESNEMNNKRSGNFTIKKALEPDFIITEISTDPSPTTQGFYVYITVKNQGQGVDDFKGGQQYVLKSINTTNISKKGFLGLSPGKSMTVKYYATNLTPGKFSWIIKVDPDNLIAESDENNNRKVLHLTIK